MGGTPGGAADLAARLAALLRELPGARAAVLVDRDGTVMAQAPEPRGGEGAAVAQACAAVPREARAAAAALSWGEPRTLSLRWPDGHLVFGFGREGSILGVEAGPGELGGRMRHAVRQALVDPEDA